MSVYHDTLNELTALAGKRPAVLVAFSGGKDSLAVLDLCCKVFPRVSAFFSYTVPGLELNEHWMRLAKTRWGVEVVRQPSCATMWALKNGIWCDPVAAFDGLKEYELKEAWAYAMEATGVGLLATGMKDADGLKRRQFFENISRKPDPVWSNAIHPLRRWRKKDVLNYLRTNGIPVPEQEKGKVTSGVGFNHDSICWLHDTHPADWKIFTRWFPYAEACIKRREWFGVA